MNKLRIIISSNAPHSNSGYGQQMQELLPRISKAGYPLATIDFFGLQGNSIETTTYPGVKQYPVINHVYGSDAMVLHGMDFKADVVFTLQDIWVLTPQDLQNTNHWIPICVDGNTLVSFVDGRKIKIKEVVENKIKGKVWGYKDGKVIKTEIKAWQKIPEKSDVYELKTKSHKLLITGNNEVWTTSIISRASSTTQNEPENEPEWKRADCIIPNDVIYSIQHEPSTKKSSNKKYSTNSDRSGILRWFNRWRRNSNDNESKKETGKRNKTHNSSFCSNNEYRHENDQMGSRENKCKNEQSDTIYWKLIQSNYKKIFQIYKNLLFSFNMGLQLFTNPRTSFALSYNQERTSGIDNRIYKVKTSTAKNTLQRVLFSTGNRYLGESKDIKPEIVMAIKKVKAPKRTVYDISTKTGNFFANNLLIHNCPIDQEPAPKNVIDLLKYAYKVITYSKFGHQQLLDNGIFSTYIPHTIDTSIFKPMDKKDRKIKAGLDPNCFLFGMVAANKDNPPRKSFQEVLDAFKMFLAVEPNSKLYIHTNPQFPGGFPIDYYAQIIGIADKVIFPDNYQMNFNMGKKEMALVYNTFDCLLAPSASEGFCVPLIEAQACGIPCITNDFTSMKELVIDDKTGYHTELGSKRFVQSGSYWGIPSTKSILDCMNKIYRANKVQMGKEARKFIVENYDSDTVFKEKWLDFLSNLEDELVPKENKVI